MAYRQGKEIEVKRFRETMSRRFVTTVLEAMSDLQAQLSSATLSDQTDWVKARAQSLLMLVRHPMAV